MRISPAITKELGKYIAAHYSSQRRTRKGARNQSVPSYWRALPGWLAKKNFRSNTDRRAGNRFLRDVILGQRLLYLAIRIQDDLFDGQVQSRSLIYASDELLIEADEVFSNYFSKDSRFWALYRDCLRTTTQAIVEADRLQKSHRTKPERILKQYAKVCSIFKIGSAAVCARSKRWRDFPQVSRFCDEMAMAGQIIDDLTDVQEDLVRKRFNYAANIFYRSTSAGKAPNVMQRISQGYLTGNGLEKIFREVQTHVSKARKAIKSLRIPEADAHLSRYEALVREIQDEFSRRRVNAFFGALLSTE